MSKLVSTPLTVVGAGPAGIMAAYTAAELGVDVTIIDDNPFPGGQYYRKSPSEFQFENPNDAFSGRKDANAILNKLAHQKIHAIYNTSVWGVFDKHKLALADQERSYELPTDRVILATGAYDRPFAFPGWTLPGILGAGATLRMIKTQWVFPGKRILLAGLGPLQLALADALVHLGAKVVCVVEAANPYKNWKQLFHIIEHPDRMQEALGYLYTLRKNKVPILYNHAIIHADGKDQVQQARVAKVDNSGRLIPDPVKQYDVDAICLGYGLLPSIQLMSAFGCKLHYNPCLGWWVPEHNSMMETSQLGIFVAGDVTNIGGSKVALLEGQIAGLTAAFQLKYINDEAYKEKLIPLLMLHNRLDRLTNALQQIYSFRPGLLNLATDETLICRCEEVTVGQAKEAIKQGMKDLHQVKLATRTGMGYCQGRFCSPLVAPLIAEVTGEPLLDLLPFTVRPPIQPLPLRILASGSR